jgi:hypothetical protein
VGVLVSLFKRARNHGGRVLIQGAAGQPLAVFKLLALHRVFVHLDGPVDAAVTSELRDAS